MPNFIAFADLEPKDRFGIVVARWNEAITRKLLDGAVAKLQERGVADDVIDVAWVPGAMEIPLVAKRLAEARPLPGDHLSRRRDPRRNFARPAHQPLRQPRNHASIDRRQHSRVVRRTNV